MLNENDKNKKLIRFSNIYDYNFLLYNIILILNDLDCYENKYFNDHRKLPILIELLNSEKLRNIVISNINSNNVYSIDSQDLLYDLIGRAKYIRKQIIQLIVSLNRKGFFSIETKNDNLNISIPSKDMVRDLLCKDFFEEDINNIKLINSIIKRVRSTKYETFIDKLFDSKGVITWQL